MYILLGRESNPACWDGNPASYYCTPLTPEYKLKWLCLVAFMLAKLNMFLRYLSLSLSNGPLWSCKQAESWESILWPISYWQSLTKVCFESLNKMFFWRTILEWTMIISKIAIISSERIIFVDKRWCLYNQKAQKKSLKVLSLSEPGMKNSFS